jgi:hypothetical protein
VSSGNAELALKIGERGWTWAFSLVALNSAEFETMPLATETEAYPPWQSEQPRKTVFVGCMEGSSVEEWQETQPDDLRAASCWDWPRTGEESCEARTGTTLSTPKAKTNDNAQTAKALMFRGEKRLR